MKPLFKNIIISFLIIILAFIVYYFFLNSRPVATAKQENIEFPIVNTLKLSSIKYLLNIKTYGEIVSDRILNIKYREKFNFPFIIAVKGKDKNEILNNFRQRISNDIKEEFLEAKTQVKKIATFRLNEIMNNSYS